jgi:ATP synthase protein I
MTDEIPRGDKRVLASIRQRIARHAQARREGELTFARHLAQIGVLGWTIVIPALMGVFIGRWVDQRLGTGIFWTGPLLMVGLAVGCWAAWRWIRGQ